MHIPVRSAAAAGAVIGLVVGLVVGAFAGALLVWLAGALLDWQRDLAFTLGVARRLLPFGDQTALLRGVDSLWYVAIPAVSLVLALVAALFGALVASMVAAVYNRLPGRFRVLIRFDGRARLRQ